MKKRILSIMLAICMALMLVPTTAFAEKCQHTDIDEYQMCRTCGYPVCPACNRPNYVTYYGYNPATCENDGRWEMLCFSSSCPAECLTKNQKIEGTVPAPGHKDENKDHKCDRGCGKSDMGDHVDLNGDYRCDYGCSVTICDHDEIGESHICKACGYPICCRTCNKPFSLWTISEYPTCEYEGRYTAIDCSGNVITVTLRSFGHLDENNDHICDRAECGKAGICVHNGTVNAYQTCDYCGEPVCPKCGSSRYIEMISNGEGEPVISYNAVQATCEVAGSWEITCLRLSCENAGGTFSGTVPALGHKDKNKDYKCDICGATLFRDTRPTTPPEPKPLIGGVEKSWREIAADLAKLPSGSEVIIELNGITTVPVEVIKVIDERDLKVTFVVDRVKRWKTDGSEITAPATADLTFTKTTSTKSDSLRGIEGTQFKINDTNIPTDIQIAFKTEHAGKFANLYKSVDGKLTFVTCAKLSEDGKVILTDVDEKGDYVAMLCEFSDISGDMSNDGMVNVMDALAVLKQAAGLMKGKNPLVADMNNDSLINAKDALLILKKAAGIE